MSYSNCFFKSANLSWANVTSISGALGTGTVNCMASESLRNVPMSVRRFKFCDRSIKRPWSSESTSPGPCLKLSCQTSASFCGGTGIVCNNSWAKLWQRAAFKQTSSTMATSAFCESELVSASSHSADGQRTMPYCQPKSCKDRAWTNLNNFKTIRAQRSECLSIMSQHDTEQ